MESPGPGGSGALEARAGADGAGGKQLPCNGEGIFTFQGQAWDPAAEGCGTEGWEEGESASLEMFELGDDGDAGRDDGVVGAEIAESFAKEACLWGAGEARPRGGEEANGDGVGREDGNGDVTSRHAKHASFPQELENDSDGAIESLECYQAEDGAPGERWGEGEVVAEGISEMVMSVISVCPSRSDSRGESRALSLPLTPITAPAQVVVSHVTVVVAFTSPLELRKPFLILGVSLQAMGAAGAQPPLPAPGQSSGTLNKRASVKDKALAPNSGAPPLSQLPTSTPAALQAVSAAAAATTMSINYR